jgi:phospholipid-binding lipoprotein MlaA
MLIPRRPAALALLIFGAGLLTGCATLPNGKPDPRDRFERVNRGIYRFNTALDHAILRPVARGYVNVTPTPVRHSISNFFSNLSYPTTIVNDFLQAKFHDGVSDTARFVVNSTFGVGGLFDVATPTGLDRHNEDFGQTLGKWGVPPGPYLMLPFLGPSTLRDAPTRLVDEYTTPRAYIRDPYVRWGLYVLDKVDERAQLLPTDAVIDQAYDPYAFVRNAWLQHREFEVRDGDVPPEDFDTDDSSAPPDQQPNPPPK